MATAKTLPTIAQLRDAFRPLFQRGGAQRAILYGSYARGEADSFSDIDLIIIAKSKRPFIERFKDFFGLWEVSPVKALEVLVYTPREFARMRKAGNAFLAQALQEGKVIYEARGAARGGTVAPAGRQ